MTKAEWLQSVTQNYQLLEKFISSWHPKSLREVEEEERELYSVTAPTAERACIAVREQIRKTAPVDPCSRFARAVETSDVSEIYSVLNQTWFGVPESTSCWWIDGFKEAVALLEDPPEEEDAEGV